MYFHLKLVCVCVSPGNAQHQQREKSITTVWNFWKRMNMNQSQMKIAWDLTIADGESTTKISQSYTHSRFHVEGGANQRNVTDEEEAKISTFAARLRISRVGWNCTSFLKMSGDTDLHQNNDK